MRVEQLFVRPTTLQPDKDNNTNASACWQDGDTKTTHDSALNDGTDGPHKEPLSDEPVRSLTTHPNLRARHSILRTMAADRKADRDHEPVVSPSQPMPKGYVFVRKGNVYITAHCRRATHAAGRTVYVVVQPSPKKVLGLRCPQHIVDTVRAAERASRDARNAATDKRDDSLAATFREALLARYPAVPPKTVPRIVEHTMKKHSGRVARAGKLELATRVRLAVRAHIRHCCTDYEALLKARLAGGENTKGKQGKKGKKGKHGTKCTKGKARGEQVQQIRHEVRMSTIGRVNAIEKQWAGTLQKGDTQNKGAPTAKGKQEGGNGNGGEAQKTKTTSTTRSSTERQGSKMETAIVIDSDDDGDADFIVIDDSDDD